MHRRNDLLNLNEMHPLENTLRAINSRISKGREPKLRRQDPLSATISLLWIAAFIGIADGSASTSRE